MLEISAAKLTRSPNVILERQPLLRQNKMRKLGTKAARKFRHWESPDGRVLLVRGDCLDVLPTLRPNSIDSIITDPPYHLAAGKNSGRGFMGKAWDGGDIAFRPETWAAALRVAKPGAFVAAFGGTRTFHRQACAMEDAGWQIRDTLKPALRERVSQVDGYFQSDRQASRREEKKDPRRPLARIGATYAQDAWTAEFKDSVLSPRPITAAATPWAGYGTALKPAWEPVLLAMKPLDGTFAENAARHGVAGLNIDGCRIQGENPSAQRRATAARTGRTPTSRSGGSGRSETKGQFCNRTTPERFCEPRAGD